MRRSLLLGALALAGCSAVVDGLEPPACNSNAQCAILNELEGIAADACELYQCSESAVCELGVRDADRDGRVAPECASFAPELPVDCNDAVASGTEVCNGRDDDCDGVIDERFVVDGAATSPLPAEPPVALVTGGAFSGSGSVAYGAAGNALAMAHAKNGSARFGLVSGAMAVGPFDMSFARAASLTDVTSTSLVPGCHVWDPASGSFVEGDCRFHEVALGLTGESVFAATVSRGGCTHGQVRVGYFPRSSAANPEVIQRGPLRRSNAFAGIDVGLMPPSNVRCTGASRTSGAWGAARPALAAMDLSGAGDQALAAWIADGFDRPRCGGEEAEVEVLGLHVQEATFGSRYGWVTASNEGLPRAVGLTTQGGRPGVGVWENTGYVVAFGATGGGIQLVFVDMMEAPAPFSPGDPDDRTGLETAALRVTDLGTIGSGAADDVVVALGSIRSGGIDLGLAWREGCGGGDERIRFRQLFLARDSAAGVAIDEARSFPAIELTGGPTPEAGAPALVYTYGGMLEPGVARADGRPTGTELNDGGWIVAWADASEPDPGPADDTRIVARRVSEADGALLSPDEVLVLSTPGDVRRGSPVLYRDAEDRVLYAFLRSGAESGFRGGALTCVPE